MNDGLPKCVTGLNPSGLCSCCRKDGRKCCYGCEDSNDCNISCEWVEVEDNESKN